MATSWSRGHCESALETGVRRKLVKNKKPFLIIILSIFFVGSGVFRYHLSKTKNVKFLLFCPLFSFLHIFPSLFFFVHFKCTFKCAASFARVSYTIFSIQKVSARKVKIKSSALKIKKQTTGPENRTKNGNLDGKKFGGKNKSGI